MSKFAFVFAFLTFSLLLGCMEAVVTVDRATGTYQVDRYGANQFEKSKKKKSNYVCFIPKKK